MPLPILSHYSVLHGQELSQLTVEEGGCLLGLINVDKYLCAETN